MTVQQRPPYPPQPNAPGQWPSQQPGPGYAPPPPPGFGPPVPPSQGGPSVAVIVVIVVVVILALVIVVPAMLYVAVTSEGPGPAPRPTVALSSGMWNGDSAVVTITSVSSATITVAFLVYQVIAGNGTIYFSGAAGSGTSVNGVTTAITYNDAGGSGEGFVGPDDNIVIHVSPMAGLNQIHGTTLRVLLNSDVIGTTTLP